MAPEKYTALTEYLNRDYGAEKFSDLLETKAAEYGMELNETNRSMLEEEAYAELSEKMLSDTKALEKFASRELDTAKTFRSQLKKVSDTIHNTLNKLGLDLGKSAAKDIKYAQDTVDAWLDGMTTAISNAQKRKAQGEQRQQVKTEQKQETSTAQETKAEQEARKGTVQELELALEAAREDVKNWEKHIDWQKRNNLSTETSRELLAEGVQNVRLVEKMLAKAQKGDALSSEELATLDSIYDNQVGYGKSSVKDWKAFREQTQQKEETKASYSQNDSARYDYSKSFAEQIEDFKAGKFPKRDTFILGGTPEVLRKIGLSSLPVTMDQEHVKRALFGDKKDNHFLGEEKLKRLPSLLADPIAIIGSATHPTDSVMVITKEKVNGHQLAVPVQIDVDGVANVTIFDSNPAASAQGRPNAISKLLREAIEKEARGEEAGVYYWNKKEALAMVDAELQLLGRHIVNGYIHSIADANSPVNRKYQEQTETRQFKNWFGKSVVKNADGTPKRVYHGTLDARATVADEFGWNSPKPNSMFTVFDRSKSNYADGDSGAYFFASNRNVAESYAPSVKENDVNRDREPHVYEVFLKIENPLVIEGNGAAWNDIPVPDSIPKKKYYNYKTHEYQLSDTAKTEYFVKYAKENGYDGVVFKDIVDYNAEDHSLLGDVYAVFDSTQIKSATDNIGLFDRENPDIRYSLNDSNGRELSKAQQEYFKDSVIRDEQGRLKVMYHGSKKGGGFTVFKGWQYFTENKAYAERYSQYWNKDSMYSVYLDVKKPFDTRNPEDAKLYEQMRQELGLSDLMEDGLPDWTAGYDIADYIDENDLDYDGIILNEGGDLVNGQPVSRGESIVVRHASQIKNVDNLNPTSNSDIRFSLDSAVEETRDLIAVHNVSADNLLKTLKLGGFPAPSIAITKAKTGFSEFGDISVVFGKETIDPEANSENHVYGEDTFTPTFPEASKLSGHDTFLSNLPYWDYKDSFFGEIPAYEYSLAVQNKMSPAKYMERYFNDPSMMQAFQVATKRNPVPLVYNEAGEVDIAASKKAVKQATDMKAYEAWLKSYADKLALPEYFAENGKRFPVTADGAVAAMREQRIVGATGEGRADYDPYIALAREYTNVDAIKADKGKLDYNEHIVEDYDEVVYTVMNRYADLVYKLDYKTIDFIASTVRQSSPNMTATELAEEVNKQFGSTVLTLADAKELLEIRDAVWNSDAGYFEAKPMRNIPLSEAKLVIVPEGTSQELLDVLNKNNIPVETYEAGNEQARLDLLNGATARQYMFATDNLGLAEYRKPISMQDVETLRSIGRKSVSSFTSADLQKAGKWAYKFYQELGTKSPFFRAWFGDWRAKDTITQVSIADASTSQNKTSGKIPNPDTGMIISWSTDLRGETRIHSKKAAFLFLR